MHKPIKSHWTDVERVLRYFKGTISHGIYFRNTLIFLYMPTMMLIGQVVMMIILLLVLIFYFLAAILFCGVHENNILLPTPLLKLNTDLLFPLLPIYARSNPY